MTVLPLAGCSDHAGEIRLVGAPPRRGSGLGPELARHALVQAVEAGLAKLIVEVVADQNPALTLFTGLGRRLVRPQALTPLPGVSYNTLMVRRRSRVDGAAG